MNSVAQHYDRDKKPTSNAEFDWLAYAHAVAEQERQRLAALASKRLPDDERRSIEAAQHDLERRRAEDRAARLAAGVDPAPRPAPIPQRLPVDQAKPAVDLVAPVQPASAPRNTPTSDYSLSLVLYSALAPLAIKARKAGGLRLYVVLQRQARRNCGRAWYTQLEIVAFYEELGMTAKQARHDISQACGLFVEYMGRDRCDRRVKRYRMIAKERVLLPAPRPGPAVLRSRRAVRQPDTFCAFA
jgi:hypothetical protein